MKGSKALFAVLGVVASTGVVATPAGADPINAAKSETLTLDCEVLGTIDVVLNGNGLWTPGHVIGSTRVVIPYRLHFEFTPTNGPTQTEDQSKREPRNRPLDVCTFGDTIPGQGTFSGTAWVSYTK